MYKIVFIITGLGIGGVENNLLNLVRILNKEKFSLHVISLTNLGEVGEEIIKLGIHVDFLEMNKSIFKFIKSLFRLNSILTTNSPDLVHTMMYHADFIGGIISRIKKVKKIIWGIYASDFEKSKSRLTTRLLRKVNAFISNSIPDLIISCSEIGIDYHKKIGYKGKWIFIPIPVDTNFFNPSKNSKNSLLNKLKLSKNLYLIGMIGRFHLIKNHKGFIDSAEILIKKRNDVRFVLLGPQVDNNNDFLREYIQKKGLSSYIYLLGKQDDVPGIISALDISNLLSFSEGFPTVLVEAMSCAVVCVSTDVGDAKKIIGDTGIIVPVGDNEAVAKAWNFLLNLNELERKNLAIKAREKVVNDYEISKIALLYEKIFIE